MNNHKILNYKFKTEAKSVNEYIQPLTARFLSMLGLRRKDAEFQWNFVDQREDEETPSLSIPRCPSDLGILQVSLHRIFYKDLSLKAGKVQLIQEVERADHRHRRISADLGHEMNESEPEFHRKINKTGVDNCGEWFALSRDV